MAVVFAVVMPVVVVCLLYVMFVMFAMFVYWRVSGVLRLVVLCYGCGFC